MTTIYVLTNWFSTSSLCNCFFRCLQELGPMHAEWPKMLCKCKLWEKLWKCRQLQKIKDTDVTFILWTSAVKEFKKWQNNKHQLLSCSYRIKQLSVWSSQALCLWPFSDGQRGMSALSAWCSFNHTHKLIHLLSMNVMKSHSLIWGLCTLWQRYSFKMMKPADPYYIWSLLP